MQERLRRDAVTVNRPKEKQANTQHALASAKSSRLNSYETGCNRLQPTWKCRLDTPFLATSCKFADAYNATIQHQPSNKYNK
jgi:coproporphyrinogen III oxidase-like Fe-S oxidoreductase